MPQIRVCSIQPRPSAHYSFIFLLRSLVSLRWAEVADSLPLEYLEQLGDLKVFGGAVQLYRQRMMAVQVRVMIGECRNCTVSCTRTTVGPCRSSNSMSYADN